MSSETNPDDEVACFLAVYSILVTGPMWCLLMFGILRVLGDAVPTWLWALYFAYVPALFIGLVLGGFVKVLKGKS